MKKLTKRQTELSERKAERAAKERDQICHDVLSEIIDKACIQYFDMNYIPLVHEVERGTVTDCGVMFQSSPRQHYHVVNVLKNPQNAMSDAVAEKEALVEVVSL